MSSFSVRQPWRERVQLVRILGEVKQVLAKVGEKIKMRSQMASNAFKMAVEAETRYRALCESYKVPLSTASDEEPVGYLISLSSAQCLALNEGHNVWTLSEKGLLIKKELSAARTGYRITVNSQRVALSVEGAEEQGVVCNDIISVGGQSFVLKMIPPVYRSTHRRSV